MRAPLFEIVTAAANAAARRLTTKENVKAALRATGTSDDTLIDQYIDRVSARAAVYCKLARTGTTPPTFGAEALRATWYAEPGCYYREADQLLLPWRVPVTSISSVVEDGTTLDPNTDYKLLDGGLLQRLDSVTFAPKLWSGGKIVVVYVAGWSLPGSVPAEIEGAVIDQVKVGYLGTDRDPALRSDSTDGLGAETWAVPGGDSMGASGLLAPLEEVLDVFRDRTQA